MSNQFGFLCLYIYIYILNFQFSCLPQLAELWPSGYMDNHGIKRGICRAKERRRALYNKHKVCLLQLIMIFYITGALFKPHFLSVEDFCALGCKILYRILPLWELHIPGTVVKVGLPRS